MPAPRKKKPSAKRPAKKPPVEHEPIRDHGDVVTAPAGTTEEAVVNKLTGADQVPSLDDLSQAKAPPFDPHAGREVAPGREFGGEPEAMVTTLVFMGIDRGGDFEDNVNQLVTEAEKLGLLYITATLSHLDFDRHVEHVADLADVLPEADDEDEDEPDEERLDEEKF